MLSIKKSIKKDVQKKEESRVTIREQFNIGKKRITEEEMLKSIVGKTRNESIVILRHFGWTLQRIGNMFNITRERVRQILLNK